MKNKIKGTTQWVPPETVYPAGIPFKVVMEKMDEGDWGEMLGHQRIIRLSNTAICKDSLKGTLLHEYMHALLYISGLSESLDGNLEEGLMITLECHLSKLINFDLLGVR